MPGLVSTAGVDPATVDQKIAAAVSQMAAAIPQPATSAPPAVADASALGATSAKYALADHTHQSSVRAARLTVGSLTGGYALVTWTFTTPFAANSVPVCTATCENTGSAASPFVVNLVSPATNTAAQFIVFKAQPTTLGATLLNIAGAIISPFSNAPSGAVINAVARLPTA